MRVVDPLWAMPLDSRVGEAVSAADLVVTIEDGLAQSGFAAVLNSWMQQNDCFTPTKNFGIAKQYLEHASRDQVINELGLEPAQIAETVQRTMRGLKLS